MSGIPWIQKIFHHYLKVELFAEQNLIRDH